MFSYNPCFNNHCEICNLIFELTFMKYNNHIIIRISKIARFCQPMLNT